MLLSNKLQDVILSKVPILLCVHFIIIFSTSLSADTSCRLIDLQAAKAKNNVLENVIAKLKEEENSDISALIENPLCSEKEDLLEKWLINLKKARITLTDELGNFASANRSGDFGYTVTRWSPGTSCYRGWF